MQTAANTASTGCSRADASQSSLSELWWTAWNFQSHPTVWVQRCDQWRVNATTVIATENRVTWCLSGGEVPECRRALGPPLSRTATTSGAKATTVPMAMNRVVDEEVGHVGGPPGSEAGWECRLHRVSAMEKTPASNPNPIRAGTRAATAPPEAFRSTIVQRIVSAHRRFPRSVARGVAALAADCERRT